MGLDQTISASWISTDGYPDGSAVGLVGNNVAARGAMLTRIGPDNAVQWTRVIIPTNPSVDLNPSTVVAMPDGGAAFFGRLLHADGGLQPFGMRVSSAGEVIWARYYMYHTHGSGSIQNGVLAAPLSNGELLIAVVRTDGVSLARLDTDGVPTWTQRYPIAGSWWLTGLDTDADGGGLVSFRSFSPLYALRFDAAGAVLWSRTYSTNWTARQRMLANGDALFCGPDPAGGIRVDTNGDILWAKQYSNGCFETAEELSNGDLLLASCGYGLRTDADGTPLLAWVTPGGSCEFPRLAGTSGDTLLLATTLGTCANAQLGFMRAANADMGCVYSTAPLPSVSVPAVTSGTWTTTPAPDTLHTWTMALPLPISFDDLDVEVLLAHGRPRPGFQFQYSALVLDQSAQPSGPLEVTLAYDPALTFVSATPPPSSTTSNSVTWFAQPPMQALSVRNYSVHLSVPASMPTGTPLVASVTVAQDSTETTLVNNTDTRTAIVTGSYDPNDKQVYPEEVYLVDQDSVLDYTIRFQNTGTDTAFNVVIMDALPPEVHANSFFQGPASHPYTYLLNGNGTLSFHFNNILLPDSGTNEAASHGFVSFRIKPDETLLPGTEISNAADIYFDFNDPIHTNDAVVTLGLITGAPAVSPGRPVAYPVPSGEALSVSLPPDLEVHSYEITTIDGRMVSRMQLPATNASLTVPLKALAPGTYHLTLRNAEGQGAVVRFVRE